MDLPLALALASSLRDRPVITGTVAIGEVGLLGELRTVAGLERRLREAARLGFRRAIVPAAVAGRRDAERALDGDRASRPRSATRSAPRSAKGAPERGEPVASDARLTPDPRPDRLTARVRRVAPRGSR